MELTVVDDKVNRAWAVGEVERAGKGRMRGDAFFLWVLTRKPHDRWPSACEAHDPELRPGE